MSVVQDKFNHLVPPACMVLLSLNPLMFMELLFHRHGPRDHVAMSDAIASDLGSTCSAFWAFVGATVQL